MGRGKGRRRRTAEKDMLTSEGSSSLQKTA